MTYLQGTGVEAQAWCLLINAEASHLIVRMNAYTYTQTPFLGTTRQCVLSMTPCHDKWHRR